MSPYVLDFLKHEDCAGMNTISVMRRAKEDPSCKEGIVFFEAVKCHPQLGELYESFVGEDSKIFKERSSKLYQAHFSMFFWMDKKKELSEEKERKIYDLDMKCLQAMYKERNGHSEGWNFKTMLVNMSKLSLKCYYTVLHLRNQYDAEIATAEKNLDLISEYISDAHENYATSKKDLELRTFKLMHELRQE